MTNPTPTRMHGNAVRRVGRLERRRVTRAFAGELAGMCAADFAVERRVPRRPAAPLQAAAVAESVGVVSDAFALAGVLHLSVEGALLAVKTRRRPTHLTRRVRALLAEHHVDLVDARRTRLGGWRVTLCATCYGGDENVLSLIIRARSIGIWR